MPKKEILPIVIVILFATIFILIGVMFRILHWQFLGINGSHILFFGMFLKISSLLFLIFKLFKSHNSNQNKN
jgi:hypothetical protein